MNAGDKALESIITALTHAIAMSPDPRLVILQREAISMRSAEMVEEAGRLERLKGEQARAVLWFKGNRNARG